MNFELNSFYHFLYFFTFIIFFLLLLGTYIYSSEKVNVESSQSSAPIKVDIELKRNHNFLKVAVFIKNLTTETQLLNLKLIIFKKSNGNLSKILQAKELKLNSYELALPFIAEFSIKPSDYYELKLQVFDKKGYLILEKTLDSKPV